MVCGMFSRSGILVLFGTLCSSGLGNAQSQACASERGFSPLNSKPTMVIFVFLTVTLSGEVLSAHACDWAFPKPEEHRVPNRTRMPDRENIPQTIRRTICQI